MEQVEKHSASAADDRSANQNGNNKRMNEATAFKIKRSQSTQNLRSFLSFHHWNKLSISNINDFFSNQIYIEKRNESMIRYWLDLLLDVAESAPFGVRDYLERVKRADKVYMEPGTMTS